MKIISKKDIKNYAKDWFDTGANIATIFLVLVFLWQTNILQSQFNEQKNQTGILSTQTEALVNQTKILQSEFVEKDRPWIGPEGQLDFSSIMEYSYTNYGAIPNTDAIISMIHSQNQLNRSSFQILPYGFAKIGAIIPNQHKIYEIDIPNDYVIAIKSGKAPLYLGILITYTYHQDKQGVYGEIFSYSVARGKLVLQDNWVS